MQNPAQSIKLYRIKINWGKRSISFTAPYKNPEEAKKYVISWLEQRHRDNGIYTGLSIMTAHNF